MVKGPKKQGFSAGVSLGERNEFRRGTAANLPMTPPGTPPESVMGGAKAAEPTKVAAEPSAVTVEVGGAEKEPVKPDTPENARDIGIQVQTMTGKKIDLQVLSTIKVRGLKEEIFALEKIAVDEQRLIYAGKQLEDDKSLEKYRVRDGGMLTLLIKFK